uniref:hypothetical protein n=1 Tax=Pseudomonas sp. Z003-0.4C(8344-21) TaxID=1855380 RepID=UPI000B82C6DC|nr:hypothetical protein [Pseudomonas sp. Z003-0.4C(8344-21)]
MRHRGDIFWAWADPELHNRMHDETLSNGTHIDVQVRLSRTGETQLFIGVYASDGVAMHEEAVCPGAGESMTCALAWGVERARQVALDQGSKNRPAVASK